jgi:PAS domain S-box-containing protein
MDPELYQSNRRERDGVLDEPPGVQSSRDWLVGGGALGELIRATDWTDTPLGSRDRWPLSMRTVVNLVVESQFPMALLWGPELILLYNDAYRAIAMDRHPRALGRPTREIWPEVWQISEPIFAATLRRGETTYLEDSLFPIDRQGRRDEAFFTLCYSPVRVEDGSVGGCLVTLLETTRRVRERHAQKETLAALVDSMPDEVWFADTHKHFTLANAAAVREFALGSVEAVDVEGLAVRLQVLRPDGSPRPTEEAPPLRALSGEKIVDQEEIIRTPATGELRWREVSASPVRDVSGNIIGSVSVVRDITERKRAEEALRQSEERHRVALTNEKQLLEAVMEALPVGVAITDAAGGNITANAAFERIWSGPRPPTLNVSDYQAYKAWRADTGTPVAPEEWASAQAVQQGRTVVGQLFEIERFDGSHAFITNSAAPVLDSGGNVVGSAVAIQDVTDLRQSIAEREAARAELERTSQRLSEILTSISDDFYVLDRNWRFVYANRRFTSRIGKEPEDFLGKSIWEMFPKHLGTVYEENVRAAMDRKETRRFEISGKYTAAVYRMTAFPSADGITLLGTDVTEQKQAEEALRIHNAVLAGIARIFREALTCSTEEQLGCVCLEVAEQVTESQFGFVGGVNAGTGVLDAIAISDPGWDACQMRDRSGHAPRLPPSFRITGLYGEVLRTSRSLLTNAPAAHPASTGTPEGHPPLRAFLGVPLIHAGRAIGMFGLGNRDGGYGPVQLEAAEALAPAIVQAFLSKRGELELKEANQRLEDADRRKNEFLAVLSHELRNPLAPIRNSLYILGRVPPGSGQAERAQSVIDRQVGHLSELVDDLLDLTRISQNKIQLQKTRLELNEVLHKDVEDNRTLFERSEVRLELVTAPSPIYLYADRTRITQIIGNLLQNAAKFSRPGGHARVSAALEQSQAVVRVTDDGVGMAPEVVEKLFQPFMQAEQSLDRSKGGLGLGLALVKQLAQLHGGTVSASSAGPDRGSEFVLRLPAESGDAGEIEP